MYSTMYKAFLCDFAAMAAAFFQQCHLSMTGAERKTGFHQRSSSNRVHVDGRAVRHKRELPRNFCPVRRFLLFLRITYNSRLESAVRLGLVLYSQFISRTPLFEDEPDEEEEPLSVWKTGKCKFYTSVAFERRFLLRLTYTRECVCTLTWSIPNTAESELFFADISAETGLNCLSLRLERLMVMICNERKKRFEVNSRNSNQ